MLHVHPLVFQPIRPGISRPPESRPCRAVYPRHTYQWPGAIRAARSHSDEKYLVAHAPMSRTVQPFRFSGICISLRRLSNRRRMCHSPCTTPCPRSMGCAQRMPLILPEFSPRCRMPCCRATKILSAQNGTRGSIRVRKRRNNTASCSWGNKFRCRSIDLARIFVFHNDTEQLKQRQNFPHGVDFFRGKL